MGGGGARPAKKLATAVPAAPGGYGEIRNPSLIALTASGITDALCAGVRSRALLAMVADTLLTEAYEVEGVLTGPLVVVGSRARRHGGPILSGGGRRRRFIRAEDLVLAVPRLSRSSCRVGPSPRPRS